MTFRLTVANHLDPLVLRLADSLAQIEADPFQRQVVAVPGDGVRTWLVQRLARVLGATQRQSDGIVANVEFIFPGALVHRALGDDQSSASWGIGPLTWAIYELMHTDGPSLGLSADAVRARSIADLFDKYTVHRSEMVGMWERGVDVDASGNALPLSASWQPSLWRLILERFGRPSDITRMRDAIAALNSGRIEPSLPDHVHLFGLASLPGPHLDVLTALGSCREVHVLAPVTSLVWWQRLVDVVDPNRPSLTSPSPLPRAADPTSQILGHRLALTWGRAPREAHLLLADAANHAGSTPGSSVVAALSDPTHPSADTSGLLGVLQRAIVADIDPPGAPAVGCIDERFVHQSDDRSVQWHRCYGVTRQVEVLRDVLIRLLDERDETGAARFDPRDIAILCPDIATFAPLAEAAFAGDPAHGVPALPLRIADRSLRQDNPLLAGVGALLELLDGRFRSASVLAFAARPPVAKRFGFTADRIGTLSDWVEATNVRWGLDPSAREAFGVPGDLAAFTWQAGIDQLLLGSMMDSDGAAQLGPGGVVPFQDIEGDDVELAGAFADLVHQLGRSVSELSTAQPVSGWCEALRRSAVALLSVDDIDSWQWRDLERELEAMIADSAFAGAPSTRNVPAAELVASFVARLGGRPGRARFGTGAITMSSFTAQRGVPHRVVCLLGLDGDLGVSSAGLSDDLIAQLACVGDRDPRHETRAQLLDALLAAGERLIICSTGHELRTNTEVPPAVPLAELLDLIDASARSAWVATGSVSAAIAIEHPRQAWSEVNFAPDALGVDGPWSFDAGARDAALSRRGQRVDSEPFLAEPLEPVVRDELSLADLTLALDNPARVLLQQRLGLTLSDDDDVRDDLVPLAQSSLVGWKIADGLLAERMVSGGSWSESDDERWEQVQRSRGSVPPFAFGDAPLDMARTTASLVFAAVTSELGEAGLAERRSIGIDLPIDGGRRITGEISGVYGSVLVDASPSEASAKRWLRAWVRVALLNAIDPDGQWSALVIGMPKKTSKAGGSSPSVQIRRIELCSPSDAGQIIDVVVDLYDRAMCSAVPLFSRVSPKLASGDRAGAGTQWRSSTDRPTGDSTDRWASIIYGDIDFELLLAEPPLDDERGDGWPSMTSRAEVWAERIWSAFKATTVAEAAASDGDDTDSQIEGDEQSD